MMQKQRRRHALQSSRLWPLRERGSELTIDFSTQKVRHAETLTDRHLLPKKQYKTKQTACIYYRFNRKPFVRGGGVRRRAAARHPGPNDTPTEPLFTFYCDLHRICTGKQMTNIHFADSVQCCSMHQVLDGIFSRPRRTQGAVLSNVGARNRLQPQSTARINSVRRQLTPSDPGDVACWDDREKTLME